MTGQTRRWNALPLRPTTAQTTHGDSRDMTGVEWHERAACRGMGSDLFFPSIGDHKKAQAAKRVCEGCEARADCLADALATNQQHGVWGGLTVRARRQLRARTAAPTAA